MTTPPLHDRLRSLAATYEAAADVADSRASLHLQYGEKPDAEKQRARAIRARASAVDIRLAASIVARKERAGAFVPPTMQEALDYAREHLPQWPAEDVRAWWKHFQSNGWLVSGKARMKDWQCAADNGFARWRKEHPGMSASTAGSDPDGWREFVAKKKARLPGTGSYASAPGWLKDKFDRR